MAVIAQAAVGNVAAEGRGWFNKEIRPGLPRVFVPYLGGMARYIEICDDVARHGYEGFILGKSAASAYPSRRNPLERSRS